MADNEIILTPAEALVPDRLFAPTAKAAERVLEFFTAQINNDNTRSAYLIATKRFTQWCEDHGIRELSRGQALSRRSLRQGVCRSSSHLPQ
jgi:hypothetical protein